MAVLPLTEHPQIYLLLGQSNMAGRGVVGHEDRTPHPRVLTLDASGEWRTAIEPITTDATGKAGVGPGVSFGKAMAEHDPDVTVGLVPCAVGGTPLRRWQQSGDLYAAAVQRARLAMRIGTLRGVLWHQGESDISAGLAPTYATRLDQMIRDLRADLESPGLAFVAGALGEFLGTRSGNAADVDIVNAALATLPERMVHTGSVSVAGLTHTGDHLHFDTASQRELGRRFASEMIRLQSRP